MATAPSSSLASIGITTSEQLVKALKASSDPPLGLRVSKSTLACIAWSDAELRVPRKAELLSEWALDSLCRVLKGAAGTDKGKGKGRASEAGASLADAKTWGLLEATLRALSLPTRNALAGKHNVLQLIISAIAQPALASDAALLAHMSAALALLLPAATARAAHSIDAVADAIMALLEALPRLLEQKETQVQGKKGWSAARACAALLGPLVAGWTAALELGSNGKKASRHFLSNAVALFLSARERVTSLPASGARSSLLRSLEQLSREALFSQDLLSALVSSPSGANELFTALRSAAAAGPEAAGAVLAALPVLLTQLTSRLAAHRAALFPIAAEAQLSAAAAAAQQVAHERHAALQGFVSPAFALLEVLDGSVEARATARAELLGAVEIHALFVPGGDDASAWRGVLKAAGEGALADLQLAAAPTGSVEALLILSRLADSVASPLLPAALAVLAPATTRSPLGTAAAALLASLVDAASAQREVPQLLSLLLGALDAAASEAPLAGSALPSAFVLRGPLMAPAFRAQIATALEVFIAPAQVLLLLPLLREKLGELLTRLGEEREGSPRPVKRTRTVRGAQGARADEAGARLAARIVLALRLTSGVVQSVVLPLPMRAELVGELKQLHDQAVLPLLDAKEDAVVSEALGLRSAIVARVALLQLGTAAEEEESEESAKPAQWLDRGIDARLEALLERAKEAEPELLRAITRTVLERIQPEGLAGRQGSGGWETSLTLQPGSLASLLVQAALATSPSGAEEQWDGELHGLLSGTQSAQALWSALAWEWASGLDACAHVDVLHRLVRDVLLPSLALAPAPHASLKHLEPISKILISNAAFLELRNWAAPIFVVASEGGKEGEQLARLLAVAQLPVAYWSATQRAELEACAWRVDAWLSKQKPAGETEAQWAALRRWMTRLVARSSGDAAPSAKLVQLVGSVRKTSTAQSVLLRSTMALFDALARQALQHALRLARSSAAGAQEAWEALVALESELGAQAAKQKEPSPAAEARVRLVELVLAETGGKAKHVPSSVLVSLAKALPCSQDVASGIAASIQAQFQAGSSTALKEACKELRTLCTRLSLSQVAASEGRANKQVAADALHALTGSEVLLAACGAISAANDAAARVDAAEFASQLVRLYAICLRISSAAQAPAVAVVEVDGEVQQVAPMEIDEDPSSAAAAEDGTLGSRVALAFASLSSAFEDRSTLEQLSTAYAQCTSATSAADYDATLSAVRLSIVADEEMSASDRAALLSTAGVLLRNGPEGTLTLAQRHWTRLLSALRARIADQPALTLPALEVVEHVCSGKAMLLRLADAGLLFALLSDLVGARSSPETTHGGQPGSEIFGAIVALLASLIRLRPDIVAPLLPHLTVLLSQLLGLLPALRPEAGAAHSRAVHARLPAWLDVSRRALTSTDARALSRLLSSLTSKSVARASRTDGASSALKSASLARGFSKHAPYVLAAHVRSLVAPTTHLGPRVRAELKAGLFALCDVIGTHERDALMVAHLDAGERALLKEIWGEWETQRYRGQ